MNRTYRLLAAAGLSALAFAACDDAGNEPPQNQEPVDPCAGVECDGENESCDPAAGVCKCGGAAGVVCRDDEACVLDPAPTCVSTACDLVTCTGGQTCDPADGVCKCGGAGGVICGDEQTCNPGTRTCEPGPCDEVACAHGQLCDPADGVCKCGAAPCGAGQACEAGTCVESDLCEGVTCSAGQTCDADDGICKCGASACSFGQRCEAGACVADSCAGVNCGPNSTCNPDDGQCHCGSATGQVCSSGQACAEDGANPGTFVCETSQVCADAANRCRGGTTCDPADGQCRCGVGPGAPVCGANQTCNLETGACQGGNQCAGVDCDALPGTSCDPEDGICKCGGLGGTECVAGQACLPVENEDREVVPTCLDRCNPIGNPTGCVGDTACYYDAAEALSYCTTPGDQQQDATCDSPTACGPGLHCTLGTATPVCRRYCAVPEPGADDTCAGDAICLQLDGADDGVGTCRTVN